MPETPLPRDDGGGESWAARLKSGRFKTVYQKGFAVCGTMQIPHFVRDDNPREGSFVEEQDVRMGHLSPVCRSWTG